VVVADLTVAADLQRRRAAAADGALELLVNNAGFGTVSPFAGLTPSAREEIRLSVVALRA
jgi:short-subunit dehydrogenase